MKKFNWILLTLGLVITLSFAGLAQYYYRIKSRQGSVSQKNNFVTIFYRALEGLDYLFYDLRMMGRGEIKPDSPIVLLTIDDISIEQIGRWPWSREKIAKVLENMFKYGTKVVGLDIVFSEPQENPLAPYAQIPPSDDPQQKYLLNPDQSLLDLMDTYPTQIVLGAFPDQGLAPPSLPYQDYCRNEAFLEYNASQFIKIENITFAVIDNADPFEEINFGPLFQPIFDYLKNDFNRREYPKHFNKSIESLSHFEKRRLASLQNQYLLTYCSRWLTSEDEFRETSEQFFNKLETPKLTINDFKKRVLIYPIHQYDAWTINTPELQNKSIYTGSFMALQDNDGKIRRQDLFYRTGQRLGLSFVPALSLQTYLAANPGYQAQVEIDIDPENAEQKIIKSMKIININDDTLIQELPVDGKGQLLINYAGSRNMYPYISAKDLLTDKEDMLIYEKQWHPDMKQYVLAERRVKKAEFLKDKVALFGATATAVYDLRVTPFDKNFPGPEIHINALSNLFQKQFLKSPREESRWMPTFLIGLGLLLTALLAILGPLWGLLSVLVTLAILFYIDFSLLANGLIVTTVIPVLMVLFQFLAITLMKYFTEERKKKELRSTFSKYVSPAIVDEILSAPENLELGGRKQNVSIFFSDVRGFTTISEKLDPQALSAVLNRYLTPMTEIVFNNKGTLDKYMGDAVMAFFGAPIAYDTHPQAACQAALDSIEKLKLLQVEFAKDNLPIIDIGIGINTADVSVGNMGSNIVLSYTVMGDGVNLASRLEGINKEYGTRIVISQFTYARVHQEFVCRELDRVKVKGKKEPVTIFELLSKRSTHPEPLKSLEIYNLALQLYYEQKFDQSRSTFNQFLVVNPKDPVSLLYLDRLDYYQANPPPSDWDGVHEMKTK